MQYSDLEHWSAWLTAAKRSEIDAALRGFYADLDAAVAERGPVCNASGRCCKFESYGHRLYVTGLEIAWFRLGVRDSELGGEGEPSDALDDANPRAPAVALEQFAPTPIPQSSLPTAYPFPDACAYQIDGLCSTHAIRPLGCRAYFCEQGTEDWQQDTTERFLERLKQLHVEHGLPYAYMEWRAGLAEAGRALAGRDDSI